MKVNELAIVRPGDKGDNCHFAIVANDTSAAAFLWDALQPEVVLKCLHADPRTKVERYQLPNIQGINIVVHDILEGGAGYGWALEKRYALAEKLMNLELDDHPNHSRHRTK